jgi:hypothetical protein
MICHLDIYLLGNLLGFVRYIIIILGAAQSKALCAYYTHTIQWDMQSTCACIQTHDIIIYIYHYHCLYIIGTSFRQKLEDSLEMVVSHTVRCLYPPILLAATVINCTDTSPHHRMAIMGGQSIKAHFKTAFSMT